MKKLSIGILCILIAFALIVSVATAKTTRYTYENWVHIQIYDGWGPAEYYGEAVKIVYTANNSWTLNQEPGTPPTEGETLRQVLQQRGKAEIYSVATNELIETREFICHEIDVDEGVDAGIWDGTWYVAWGTDFSKLEKLDYEWKIPGVYIYRAVAINGVYVEFSIWVHPMVPPNK